MTFTCGRCAFFFFSSRRRHTRCSRDWSSDVCSSDLTCNRSEVYGVPPETSRECARGLSTFLSEFHSVRLEVLNGSLYHHYDREAVRHLFRVAAGLDSMMLGEAEILGQVREAYRVAHEQGATGPV